MAKADPYAGAIYGECYLARVFYNSDPEGALVDWDDWSNCTLHGPFETEAEAEEWVAHHAEDDTDIKDVDVVTINRVRPEGGLT